MVFKVKFDEESLNGMSFCNTSAARPQRSSVLGNYGYHLP